MTDASADRLEESRALYDLAHCFLHMNQTPKARQLLDSPGLPYVRDRVEYIYEKLEEHNPKACEDLVAVTKNIFSCDRDFLYSKLVNTNKNDPDKVEDIWILIQEEGHVPSDELKIQIAKVLSSHNRTVPFEKPEETSAATEEESSNSLPPKLSAPTRKKQRDSAEKTNTKITDTVSAQRRSLKKLIEDDMLEEASKAIVEICENDNVKQLSMIISQANVLIAKFEKANKVDEMKAMFDSLGVDCQKALKTGYRYKTALIRCDPEKYMEMTSSSQDWSKLVSTEILNGAIKKNPSFLSHLESMADSGKSIAVILMTKLSLHENNREKLLKYYRSCPTNIDGSLLFDKIDTEEKFNMCLGMIDGNRSHLKTIFNRYLYTCKKGENFDVTQFVNIANTGVDRGLEVTDFSASFVQVLAERKDFKLQEEAKTSLKN